MSSKVKLSVFFLVFLRGTNRVPLYKSLSHLLLLLSKTHSSHFPLFPALRPLFLFIKKHIYGAQLLSQMLHPTYQRTFKRRWMNKAKARNFRNFIPTAFMFCQTSQCLFWFTLLRVPCSWKLCCQYVSAIKYLFCAWHCLTIYKRLFAVWIRKTN